MTVRSYHRTGQARLNAIDVAALANEHERRGKPITTRQVARYFDVPYHIALYAVQWLCLHGYAAKYDGAIYVTRIGGSPRRYTVMADEQGNPHRFHRLSASDQRFLERTGWIVVSEHSEASA